MSERFYVNCVLGPGPLLLQGAEAHHLAVVCRLRAGDPVYLFNGDGREYRAEVVLADKRSVALEVLAAERPARELPGRLEVALPLPKGDRAQVAVEKLTELGVTRLVPLRTARSVVHPGDAKLQKLERWVIEASKQCGRNVLMEIAPLTAWTAYCRDADLPPLRWLAHPGDQATSLADATARAPGLLRAGLAVAVGPEGGFTAEEVEMARAAGWQCVQLGPRLVRVETAAVGLAAWAAWQQGDQERPGA